MNILREALKYLFTGIRKQVSHLRDDIFTGRNMTGALLFVLYSAALGLPLAVTASYSFGLPDFHHGNPLRFIIAATLPFGMLYVCSYLALKESFRRYFAFSNIQGLCLTLVLSVAAGLYIWHAAAPYMFVGNRVVITPAEKQPLLVGGIFKKEIRGIPLVGSYSLEGPKADLERSLYGLNLGDPEIKMLAGDVSTHMMKDGTYVYVQGGSGKKINVSVNGMKKTVAIERNGFAPVPTTILTTEPEGGDIALRLSLPGLLLASLMAGVYLMRLGSYLWKSPYKLIPHLVCMACIFGFAYSWDYEFWFSNDPVGQFRQGMKGIYYDWHPPVMGFVWVNLCRFNEFIFGYFSAPEPFALLVRGSYWLGFALLGIYAGRKGGLAGASLMTLVALAPCVTPSFRFMFQYPWKDCMLASCCILSLGIMLNLPENRYLKNLLRIIAIFFFIIGIGARSNAVMAALPLAFIYFIDLYRHDTVMGHLKPALLGLLLFAVSTGSMYYFHYGILKTNHQNPTSYPMFKEILAIRALSGDREWPSFFPEDKQKYFDKSYNYEKHNGSTDFLLHGQLKIVELPREHYEILKKFWWRKVKEHPKEYLVQKFDSFSRLLRPYTEFKDILNPWHIFWGGIIAFFAGAFMYFGIPERRREILIVMLTALSGTMYFASYLVVAVVMDFRYMSWGLYAGLISMILLASMVNMPERFKKPHENSHPS